MSNEACRCLVTSGSHNFDSLYTDIMPDCFLKFMRANEKLLLETAKNVYGDTSDISGKKLAEETFKLVSSKLVYDCDIFYNALIEDRRSYYKKYYELNKDSIETIIETKSKVPNSLRDAKYYHLRGCDYFNIQAFSKVVNDFDSAEILDGKFFDVNIFYKAQIAEILGKYDEAIIEYEIFAKDKNWHLFHLYADMLRRKMGDNKFIEEPSRKTKDGISLGDRNDFISGCIKSANKKQINLRGFEINPINYCSCMYDNLLPTLYSDEIKAALKNKSIDNLLSSDKNLKILMDCLKNNSIIDPKMKFTELKDSAGVAKTFAISTCVKGILEDSIRSKTWTKKNAETYCTCAVENLYAKGYSFVDIEHGANENNKLYNEVVAPCFNLAIKDGTKIENLTEYRPEDIIGDVISSKVLLLNYLNQGYKIKISIDGKIEYYVFDTGASNLIINRDFERELLLGGVLTKESYLGKEYYSLVNGQQVKVQLVRLNNVKIGDYTVNNVIAGISEGNTLLCGKGFLDKFRKWKFDAEDNSLTLFK
jgi:hypothetical protein